MNNLQPCRLTQLGERMNEIETKFGIHLKEMEPKFGSRLDKLGNHIDELQQSFARVEALLEQVAKQNARAVTR